MISHIGKSRHSTIVEGSVVNTQKIVTPTQRKKRTVYHTPAIIETVVEEPDFDLPPVINVRPQAQVVRRASILTPRPTTIHPARYSTTTMRTQNTSRHVTQMPLRNGYQSRNFGVKVTQDLTSIRPPSIDQEYQTGCCHNSYVSTINCCRLFKCPFWLCCLIPLLILLSLIGGGYWWHKNHRLNFRRNTLEFEDDFNITKNLALTLRQNKNKQPEIVAPIVQQRRVINANKNNRRIINKTIEIQDKTEQIEKDQNEQKSQQEKQTLKQQNDEKSDNSEQNKQNNTDNNDNPNVNDNQNVNSSSSETSASRSTSTISTTSENKFQPSTKSLISSLLDFRLAPTFKQHWNNDIKRISPYHLRYYM